MVCLFPSLWKTPTAPKDQQGMRLLPGNHIIAGRLSLGYDRAQGFVTIR
jgi:hypothetical protein